MQQCYFSTLPEIFGQSALVVAGEAQRSRPSRVPPMTVKACQSLAQACTSPPTMLAKSLARLHHGQISSHRPFTRAFSCFTISMCRLTKIAAGLTHVPGDCCDNWYPIAARTTTFPHPRMLPVSHYSAHKYAVTASQCSIAECHILGRY